MDSDATQIDSDRLGQQILVTAVAADCSKQIHRPAASEKKVMAGTSKSRRFRSQQPTRWITVARFELIKCCPQASEVRGIARVDDIEIEGRDRCATNHGSHATNHDQLYLVPGEDFKGVFESWSAAHGATR